MKALYASHIIEHSARPLNTGLLVPADIDFREDNAMCGDHIHLTMRISEEGIITGIGWEGTGCAISRASASIFYNQVLGQSVGALKHFDRAMLLQLLGIELPEQRMKCAVLALRTFKVGVWGNTGEFDDNDKCLIMPEHMR